MLITLSLAGEGQGEGDLLNHLNNQKGFTLIELMVVVVIIVVLIAIAGTTWILSLNHLSLRNDARDIASALQKAKQLAVTRGRMHQVYFDIANEVYQIEDCNLGANNPPNECNAAPGAPNFAGSGATHGTVIGSLRDLRITSFGHKPINIDSILDGGGSAVNMVMFNTDGTARFFSSIVPSDSTTLTITLARIDVALPETKTVVISNAGGIRTP